MQLEFLQARLQEIRAQYNQEISIEDVEAAVGTLSVLGSGCKIVPLGGKRMVGALQATNSSLNHTPCCSIHIAAIHCLSLTLSNSLSNTACMKFQID